jgi:D-lyxose ketol-isomerase
MIKRKKYEEARNMAFLMIKNAGIHISPKEIEKVDVVDFGLSDIENEGIEVFTFFATERISAKVLVLFPNQTEPEHWHPPVETDPGKEEIIRAIKGDLRFYIPGEDSLKEGFLPKGKDQFYTCRNEIVMKPGDQLILKPGTKHWFQAGKEGAVMYSFSTCVRDVMDCFTDPNIVRTTVIAED